VCPHCGNADPKRVYASRARRLALACGRCAECREQFRVTVGTVFEKSKVPLHKMVSGSAFAGIQQEGDQRPSASPHSRRHLQDGVFMAHRLREAMRSDSLSPLGGAGKIVEADETFMSHMRGRPVGRRGTADKRKILTLIERGGHARSFHVRDLKIEIVAPIRSQNIAQETVLMTDEAQFYKRVGKEFSAHESVEHNAKEYVRDNVHVNTAESFFALFKRGMRGVYQHCGEKHLHRYLARNSISATTTEAPWGRR